MKDLKEIYLRYTRLKHDIEFNERIRCPHVAARYKRDMRQLENQYPEEILEIKHLINEK